jgi:PAS fold
MDPSRVWTFNFMPLPDERGAVIGGMVIARDVTDLDSDETTMSEEMARIIGVPPGSRLPLTDPAEGSGT